MTERSRFDQNTGSCTPLLAAEFTSRSPSLNFRKRGLRERKNEVRIGNSSFCGDDQPCTVTSKGCEEKGDYIPIQAYAFVYTSGPTTGAVYSKSMADMETQFPETYLSAGTPTLSYTRMGPLSVRCIRRVRYPGRLNFRTPTPPQARDNVFPEKRSANREFLIFRRLSTLQGDFERLRRKGDSIPLHTAYCLKLNPPWTEKKRRKCCLYFRIHEWAHYRYGLFDEYGTRGDSISGDVLLGRHVGWRF
ncbi:uncharacterized protein [Dermacentor albipictus]|uniref:uncharacterized protein isoform X1 n=1 Tax=Dermacentor albipictus TaxID=60249 RepID=UPI0038FBE792